jgi:hypothetical protein
MTAVPNFQRTARSHPNARPATAQFGKRPCRSRTLTRINTQNFIRINITKLLNFKELTESHALSNVPIVHANHSVVVYCMLLVNSLVNSGFEAKSIAAVAMSGEKRVRRSLITLA